MAIGSHSCGFGKKCDLHLPTFRPRATYLPTYALRAASGRETLITYRGGEKGPHAIFGNTLLPHT